MANNNPASGGQFPAQQSQHFVPMAHQQYRHLGPGLPPQNAGMPPGGQNQPMQFSQPIQQLQHWPGQPGHGPPSSHAMQMPYGQPNRPPQLGAPHLQQPGPPLGNHTPGGGAAGVPYQFVHSSYGQPQNTPQSLSHFPPMSQMPAPVGPVGGQPWLPSGGHGGATATPGQESGHQSSGTSIDPAVVAPSPSLQSAASDWQEHTASDGRRYYYNRRTRQSSWEKPVELMTPVERADASTAWKEFTTPEGKKYYYNKFTKQSKWTVPEELQLAREQAQQTVNQGTQLENNAASHASASTAVTLGETPVAAVSVSPGSSLMVSGLASGPVPVTPVVSVANPPLVVSASSAIPVTNSSTASDAGANPLPAAGPLSTVVPPASANSKTDSSSGLDNVSSQVATNHVDEARDAEEVKKGILVQGKLSAASSDEKKVPDGEPLVYANKQEAKNAFKALLESANVQSDWTWEQALREIVNDKRYGALKTPGERKQAFNEYLGQRKKIEAEERRVRQKKAREEFARMLEESKELTSSMKWSKAVNLFENDDRFKAVEKVRDREELFDTYMLELQRKEKEKAAEDHRRNITEFRKFLESCDFIKANTQWRRIQDRLEDDERCLRLEKLDRLLTFQDYIRDLEKEEEDQKKEQKEQLRRAERKTRDAFRKLLEEHVSAGIITAKTCWLDYCAKVKDSPQYHAVASNTAGSKPKDLFEDVAEELEKQYHDSKTLIKDAMKLKNIVVLSAWTFEDFKASITDDVGSQPISDINLKLLFEELVERAKEKEEKEAKKRQRLADDFTELLYTCKEVTASSSWEECKPLFEESQEYKSIAEESIARDIFEEHVAHLQEKAKEKERKRDEEKAKKEKEREEKEKRKEKEKEKEKKEKEREREKEKGKERTKKDDADNDNGDITETYGHKDEKKRDKDKDRKHRKRHQGADDVSSDKDEKEESKKFRRHGSDRKKTRKHSYSSESDGESRHKKHKRDHRDSSRKNAGEELEDGEVGEDGEIR